jgi:hypothetical protein
MLAKSNVPLVRPATEKRAVAPDPLARPGPIIALLRSYSQKRYPPHGSPDLFEAMKQVAETGRGPEEQIPSMGCSIMWRH